MIRKSIGIDLGGTNIKAGVVDEQGRLLSRVSIPTQGARGRASVIANIARAADSARAEAGAPWREISAIGIGAPGSFVGPKAVNRNTPNLPALEGVALRPLLEKRIAQPGLPLVLENDANVAAYAESWVGAGRGVETLALFTLGTGIGGGIVLNGKIWRGAWGAGAELGHQNLFPNGVRCGCGNRGCLEAYASATGLVRRFHEAIRAGKRSLLAPEGKRCRVTAQQITEAGRAGDKTCRALVEETGRWLGIGVMNILHALNAEMIVFSGGMTGAGSLLLEPIRDEARKRTFRLNFDGVKILFSRLGNDTGIIGAAGWALRVQADGKRAAR